eukprot:Colp12_sorted_trinity150504_noHs@30249
MPIIDDDEPLQLSGHAMAALAQFMAEQAAKEEAIKSNETPSGIDDFQEDWQLSQFWYSTETADKLAEAALAAAGENGSIACVSTPTLYAKLRQMNVSNRIVLFEYDKRFSRYGDGFVFYDYKQPLELPEELKGSFDVVVADPPFLSEECLTKTAESIRWLGKSKYLLCTGFVMTALAGKLLGLRTCGYYPVHEGNLANEFRCFANFDSTLGWDTME